MVELGKAITCKSFIGCDYSVQGDCTCGDEGSTATTFNIDEQVVSYARFDGEIFIGDVIKHEWWFNGELKWTWEKTATQNYANFWCGWTWWDIGQSYGPGTGHIKIYHNDNLLGQTNDFTIAGQAVELGKAITCKSFIGCDYSVQGDCTCGDEGSTATTFNIDEQVVSYARFDGEIFIGDVIKHEWWFNGELKWTWEKTATQNYANFWCGWTWWDIGQSYGPGTGHIKIYHNDNLLGQTNDFTILPIQADLCSWIEAKGGPSGLTIADVFTIIDSYLYNTPPSGYIFVPTLQNVFGVIDYYLGFDGDAATGCDFIP